MQRRRVFDALRNFFGGDRVEPEQDGPDYTDGSSYSYSEFEEEGVPADNRAEVAASQQPACSKKPIRSQSPAPRNMRDKPSDIALASSAPIQGQPRASQHRTGVQNGKHGGDDGSESSRYSLRPRRRRANYAGTEPRQAGSVTRRNTRQIPADAISEPLPQTPCASTPVDVLDRKLRQDRSPRGAVQERQLPIVPHVQSARTTSGVVGRAGITNAAEIEGATASTLRGICKELGLPSSGTKSELKKRALDKVSGSSFQGEETQPLTPGKIKGGKDNVPENARPTEMPNANSSALESRRGTTTTTTATRANCGQDQSEQPAGSRALPDGNAIPSEATDQNALPPGALQPATDDNQRSNLIPLIYPLVPHQSAPAAAMSSTGLQDFRVNESTVYATQPADNRPVCENRGHIAPSQIVSHMPPPSTPNSVTQGAASHAHVDISPTVVRGGGSLSAQRTIRELASGTRELINPVERDLCMAFLQGRTVAVDAAGGRGAPPSNAHSPSNERGHLSIPNRLVVGREVTHPDRTAGGTSGTVTPTQPRTNRPPALPLAPPNTPGLVPGSSAPRGALRRQSLQRNAAEMAVNALQRGRSASAEGNPVQLAAAAVERSPNASNGHPDWSGNIDARQSSRTETHIDGVQLQDRDAGPPANSTSDINLAPTRGDSANPTSSLIGPPRNMDGTSPTGRGLPLAFAGAEGGPAASIARQSQPPVGSSSVAGGDAEGPQSQRPPSGHPRARPAAVRISTGASPFESEKGGISAEKAAMERSNQLDQTRPTQDRLIPARPTPVRRTPARPTPIRPSGFPTPSDIIRTFNRYTPSARHTPSNRPVSTSCAQNASASRPLAPPLRRPSSERFGSIDFHRLSGSAFGVPLTPAANQSGSSPGLPRSGPSFSAEPGSGSSLFNPKRHSTGMASFRRRAISSSGGKLNDLRKSRRSVDFSRPGAHQSLQDMQAIQKWRQEDRSAAMASSAKKILEALSRTARENRVLVADRKPISPLGPPPSSLKRARDDEDLQGTEKRVRRSVADSGINFANSDNAFARMPDRQSTVRPSSSPQRRRGEGYGGSRPHDDLNSLDKKRRLFSGADDPPVRRGSKRRSMSSSIEQEGSVKNILERESTRKRRTISYGAASNLGSAFKAYALAQSKADEERKSVFGTKAVEPVSKEQILENDIGRNENSGAGRKSGMLSSADDVEPASKRPSPSNPPVFSYGPKKVEEHKPTSKSFGFNPITVTKPSDSETKESIEKKAQPTESEHMVKGTEKVDTFPTEPTPLFSKSPPDSLKKAAKAVTFGASEVFSVPSSKHMPPDRASAAPVATAEPINANQSAPSEDAKNSEAKKNDAAKAPPMFTIPKQSTVEKEMNVASSSVPAVSSSAAMFGSSASASATPFVSTSTGNGPSSAVENKKGAPAFGSIPLPKNVSDPEAVKATQKADDKAGDDATEKVEVAPKNTATPPAPFAAFQPSGDVSTLKPGRAPGAQIGSDIPTGGASASVVGAGKEASVASTVVAPKFSSGATVETATKNEPEPSKNQPAFGQASVPAESGGNVPEPLKTDPLKAGFGAAPSSSGVKPTIAAPLFALPAKQPAESESKPFTLSTSQPATSGTGKSSGFTFGATSSSASEQAKPVFPVTAGGPNNSSSTGALSFSFSAPASSQGGGMSSAPAQSDSALAKPAFGQAASSSATAPANPFGTPSTSVFGRSLPSQAASQSNSLNPFGASSADGPFAKAFPSTFNPSGAAPTKPFVFSAPASAPVAKPQIPFGGSSSGPSASISFGTPSVAAPSSGMPFSAASSGPAAAAFGGTGSGAFGGFQQSAPPGFGVTSQPFGVSSQASQPFGATEPFGGNSQAFGASAAQPFGAISQGTQAFGAPSQTAQAFGTPSQAPKLFGAPSLPAQAFGAPSPAFGAPSQAAQALFGGPAAGASAPGQFAMGQSGRPAPTQQRGRRFVRVRRTQRK